MRVLWRAVALAAAMAGISSPAPAPGPEVYRGRREALRKALPDSIIVLIGRTERDTDDLRSGFFQEPNFYYLTGWKEPGAILLLAPGIDTLFVPRRSAEREKWTGPTMAPDDSGALPRTGFPTVMPAESFESELRKALETAPNIAAVTESARTSLRALAPLREVTDAAKTIARLRMRKSAEEREAIQFATDATVAAHRAAWKRAAPGLYEYQIAATMLQVYLDRGCERSAYAPIVGAGPNSLYLHYSRNTRKMDAGELLLIDVAGECAGYASDVTRTIPVSGAFTPRQRELYEIVLGAQKAAIAAAKPGATFSRTAPGSLYRIAFDYIDTHGKDLHGEPLGKYFTHGISHHVGLEVHDAWDPEVALESGMIVTVEPGIYIPEERIGIRIEDVIEVTPEGGKLLSGALPREPGEIERILKR